MSRFAVYPDQDWIAASQRSLQGCRKFERMPRQYPVVMVASGNQRWRITLPSNNILKRRVFDQIPESFGSIRRTVVRLPRPANREFLESEHIKHTNLRNRRPKEFRVLSERRADQQSAIRCSDNRDPPGTCVLQAD